MVKSRARNQWTDVLGRTFQPGRFGHGRFGQDVLATDVLARMFWSGRFSQDVLATDVLARHGYTVVSFGQILFQHGKKLYMNFLGFYTHSICKTKAQTGVLMEFACLKKKNQKRNKDLSEELFLLIF